MYIFRYAGFPRSLRSLGMTYGFENKKTSVRELVERTYIVHSFEAYLLTVFAYSQTELEPQGGDRSERRA